MKTFLLVATLLTTFNTSAYTSPDDVDVALASKCQVWADNGHQQNIFGKIVRKAIIDCRYSINKHMQNIERGHAIITIVSANMQEQKNELLTHDESKALLYKTMCKDIAESII